MKKTPFFSIVIANYNSEKFLAKAIESVINQRFTDLELIIIDGGSNDNSLEIVDLYKSHIDYFVSEPDGGQSQAFNKGFSRAKGEYYIWLNADDVLLPRALECAYDYLSVNKKCFWLVFNTIYINEQDVIEYFHNAPYTPPIVARAQGVLIEAPTSIFHNLLYRKSKGFDENLYWAMDCELWLQFYQLGYRYKLLNEYLYAMRIHDGSKTLAKAHDIKKIELRRKQDMMVKSKYKLKESILARIIFGVMKLIFCKPYSQWHTQKWRGKRLDSYLLNERA